MDYSIIREEVARFCHVVYEKGDTQASGGNLSCRVPGTNLFAIKRTAVNMRFMTADDVVIVDEELNVVYGEGKPSKEAGFHIGVLKSRPEMNALIHCHPNYAIAIANNKMDLPLTTVTVKKAVGYVPWIETALAGSDELKQYVVDAFVKYPESVGVLMKEHGVCSVGRTLEEAYNKLDLIEQTSKQAVIQVLVAQNRDKFKELFNV